MYSPEKFDALFLSIKVSPYLMGESYGGMPKFDFNMAKANRFVLLLKQHFDSCLYFGRYVATRSAPFTVYCSSCGKIWNNFDFDFSPTKINKGQWTMREFIDNFNMTYGNLAATMAELLESIREKYQNPIVGLEL